MYSIETSHTLLKILNILIVIGFCLGFILFLLKKLIASCSSTDDPKPPPSSSLPSAENIDQALKMDWSDGIIALNTLISDKLQNIPFSELSHAEQVFYSIDYLQMEINNGGYDQYFFNSSGEFAHEALAGMREIGANLMADIHAKAMTVFPDSVVPKDRAERQKLLEQAGEKAEEMFDSLDSKFYEYSDPLEDLLLDYVKKNVDEFR